MEEKKTLTPQEFDALPAETKEKLLGQLKALKAEEEKASNQKQYTKEELAAIVKEVAEKHINSMDRVDKKHFMFPGTGLDVPKTAEEKWAKTRRFFKALVGVDMQVVREMSNEVKKGLTEGSTTGGGFLVPEEFSNEVAKLLPNYGVAARECRIMPMTRDIMYIPTLASNSSSHFVNEVAAIPGTNPVLGQASLTIKKLANLQSVSSELLADAGIDVMQFLAEDVAWAFAKRQDFELFRGTGAGTSPFVGVLAGTGTPTTPTASGTGFICLSYQDLVTSVGALYEPALAGAKFYFHRTLIAHILSRITTAGAPIFSANALNLFGYPLVSAEMLPGTDDATASVTDGTAFGVFGNLRMGVILGNRGAGIEVALSDTGNVNGVNVFETDQRAIRFIHRYCQSVLLPSAFTRIVS